MARALKVFRTAAGFHDAYVAATSRKAALAAWGSHADLFARGMAEQVTDPALTAVPLAKPGEVVFVSRGGLSDQLKALGPRKSRTADSAAAKAPARKPAKAIKPPSRARLEKAEAAIDLASEKQRVELAPLEQERERIDRKIEALEKRHAKEAASLERRRAKAQEAYRDALERWSE